MFVIYFAHVFHNLDDHLEKVNNILIGIKLFKHNNKCFTPPFLVVLVILTIGIKAGSFYLNVDQ
jgi:hypothetical protein